MTRWESFWQTVRAFLHWLAAPLRALARGLMVLVNLTPRQMQALCTLAMIGGIVALSWQNAFYVMMVKRASERGMPDDSPFFDVALDVVFYGSIMAGAFALFMSLIAFGAEWLQVKYRDFQFGTGNNQQSMQPLPRSAPAPTTAPARASPPPTAGQEESRAGPPPKGAPPEGEG